MDKEVENEAHNDLKRKLLHGVSKEAFEDVSGVLTVCRVIIPAFPFKSFSGPLCPLGPHSSSATFRSPRYLSSHHVIPCSHVCGCLHDEIIQFIEVSLKVPSGIGLVCRILCELGHIVVVRVTVFFLHGNIPDLPEHLTDVFYSFKFVNDL